MNPDDAQSTQEKFRQAAHEIVDRAIDAAGPAAQWIDTRKRGVAEGQQRAVEYASSNPIKALAIVLVVGIIIGRIVL